jgi:hypothetical protein
MAANKKAGKKSLAQNDHLFPAAPLVGTATDVGTGRAFNNGAASVTFTAQGPNAATSFTVTSSPGSFTANGATSPITVEGLQSATDYSFTVVATNEYGSSPASGSSNTILATTVPATPAAPTASSPTAGFDNISWTAPANGGTAITNYRWTSTDEKAGDTASTSAENITQEQGTAQKYTIYATNANGNSATSAESNEVTTTFSFAPFGAFGFSPFGAFGFSPFGAFGFSPFGAFGFSPFGFSPFGAFGFSPFGFSPFGFSPYSPPRCIAGDTEIAAVDTDGNLTLVKAKDIRVGDKVFSPLWDEFDGTPSPYESRIEYQSLTNKRIGIGEIEQVLEKKAEKSIIFNRNDKKHFSLTQPILARRQGQKDAWEFAGDLADGDIIWEYNFDTSSYEEVVVEDAHIESVEIDVFQISVKGIDTFIAGGIVSHNK